MLYETYSLTICVSFCSLHISDTIPSLKTVPNTVTASDTISAPIMARVKREFALPLSLSPSALEMLIRPPMPKRKNSA